MTETSEARTARYVVTGGTGFLGSHLVRILEERGASVTVVSRSAGYDIQRPETLKEVFQGASAVFHLAALVQSRPGPFEATNIGGLENVLEACLRCNVPQVVYVSSFTIFGPSRGGPHSEASIPRRTEFFHGYDRTKYEGYRLAESWRERIPLNIIFPSVIYGPGPLTEGNIIVRLFQRWAKLRLAPLPLAGRPRWNFVYVEDVAQGLIQVLDAPPGEDFILGGQDVSLAELKDLFQAASGRRIRTVSLPAALFKGGAYLEDWVSRLAGMPPLVVPATADFFLVDWEFSSQKAKSSLHYSPRPLRQGLESTHRWMKEIRLL